MVAPSSQGKSEVAISEGFRGAAPCRNCQAIKSLHHTHHHHFRFETPILYPFYFKVLTENPFSTKFVFRSASRKPINVDPVSTFFAFFFTVPTCVCIFVLFLWFFLIFCNFHDFGPFWNYFGITISKQIKSTSFVARAQSSWKHRSLQLSVMQTMTTSGTGSVTKPASGKNRPTSASCQLGHLGQSNIKRLIVSFLRFWMIKPNFHQTNACFSFFKFDVKTLPNKSPSFVAFVFSSSKKLNFSILFLVYSIPFFAVFLLFNWSDHTTFRRVPPPVPGHQNFCTKPLDTWQTAPQFLRSDRTLESSWYRWDLHCDWGCLANLGFWKILSG